MGCQLVTFFDLFLLQFLGISVGLVGMAWVAMAYPVYKWTLKKERKKIAPEILRLTDELS